MTLYHHLDPLRAKDYWTVPPEPDPQRLKPMYEELIDSLGPWQRAALELALELRQRR
jgi:hypothetical protein